MEAKDRLATATFFVADSHADWSPLVFAAMRAFW
jgi:hypothetical protein